MTEPETGEIERELGDRYQIVRALGRGAFGAVYLARERLLHRMVAIKVLQAERAWSDEERDRLLREARTIANLSDPAIIPLRYGDDASYLRRVEGTVRRLVAERLLPAEDASGSAHALSLKRLDLYSGRK